MEAIKKADRVLPALKGEQKFTLEDFLAGQLSEKTKSAYRRDLLQFFEFTKGRSLEQITYRDGIAFRNWLLEKGYTKSTINRKLSALRSLFDFAVSVGAISSNPFSSKLVRSFKRPTQIYPDILKRHEARKLIEACNDGTFAGLRDKVVILLGLVELLRVSEVVTLKVGSITEKFGIKVLELKNTKSGLTQYVKLRDDVEEAVEHYLNVLKEAMGKEPEANDPLVRSLSNQNFMGPISDRAANNILRRRLRLAGIKTKGRRISFHSLRHTGITLAIENGADLTATYLTARHSDPKTTMRYYHGRKELTNSAVDFVRF